MKRPLRPEEAHIWAKVVATVHPARGRKPPDPPPPTDAPPPAVPADASPPRAPPRFAGKPSKLLRPAPAAAPMPPPPLTAAPDPIEPRRRRRIVREQELGPRLDLHGLDQERARAALVGFLERASAEGWRAVLVITGKGALGDGILRRMTPEWLADPRLRHIVAGVSEAHRAHGGAGALYVALKRRDKA